MIPALRIDRAEESLPPGLFLLPLGAALGTHGLNLLPLPLLTVLDPAVSAGLAAIGALAGLSLNLKQPRTAEIGVGLLVLVSCLALAWFRMPVPMMAAGLTIAFAAIALTIAAAGWLLVGQTSSEREQHVFVAGTAFLLGGAAAYVSLSAVFAGLVGGAVWKAAGGESRDRLERDIRYFQHPLIVLLLIVAGARLESVPAIIGVGILSLLGIRMGKLSAGGWQPASPSMIGVALGLNFAQAWSAHPDRAAALMAVIIIASLGSELLAASFRASREYR